MLLKWGCGQALFRFNRLELSQRFADACLGPRFHFEIHLKAKSASVRFKTVAFSWVRYQHFMHSVGLVWGNRASQLHHLQSSDSHRSSHRCLLIDSYSKKKSECTVWLKRRSFLLQSSLLRGIQGVNPSEVDAYYWSISYFKKTPASSPGWAQPGSPPARGRIKDLLVLLATDGHSSFDKGFCLSHWQTK